MLLATCGRSDESTSRESPKRSYVFSGHAEDNAFQYAKSGLAGSPFPKLLASGRQKRGCSGPEL